MQALLNRHETYMQDSEVERNRLATQIEELESQKRTLENENTRVIAENRELLNQLEDLNNNITDSDTQLKSLTATLASAQYEIRRLNTLAARASHLEAELQSLETDQAHLQKVLETSQDDERSALFRWRQAECKVRDLSDQIEKIEKEASEEREKHVELLGRMERRRAVEKELGTAAGRLKGAAAATSLAQNKAGTNIVSHFVRDLLLDNSNLQAGITELREILCASNEEVENLREQVFQHQPLFVGEYDPTACLNQELEKNRPGSISQELHVHHHYHHAPNKITPRKDKAVIPRRLKKRSSPPLMTTTQRARPLRPPLSQIPSYSTSSTAIDEASSPSLGLMPISSNRWSAQSASTAPTTVISSIPSSPQSWRRNSSIFDRLEEDFDSSRPTSPESLGFVSPTLGKSRQKDTPITSCGCGDDGPQSRVHDTVMDSLDDLALSISKDDEALKNSEGSEYTKDEFEMNASVEHRSSRTTLPDGDRQFFNVASKPTRFFSDIDHESCSRLRHVSSSDSVCSVSGMDIHKVRNRPSIATITPLSGGSTRSIAMLSSAQATSSAISAVTRSSQAILTDLNRARRPQETSGFSRWVKGKWGFAPMSSTGNLRAYATVGEEARAPGINQKGFIAGLRPPTSTPSTVVVERVDEGLLRESLGE